MKQVNILRQAKRLCRFQAPFRMLVLLLGLFLTVGAFAQIDVKGHVKDAQGEPVIGATVRVVGTQTGTVTDFDGNFALKAKSGATIEVTYVGFQPAKVQAAPTVEITLQDDATTLENVVVIGYGRARKSDLTGSVTAIKPDDKNHGLNVNAQDMIQGKIAGVSVIPGDGTPGGGAQIRIRGGSSLNASNDPLIVIDGLALDNQGIKGAANPLSMVNPADIESFTVLKDASATAIYGSRGSNGVIIITTKKGRKGQKPSITYNGNVSYSFKTKDFDVLGADEYRNFIRSYYGAGSDAEALLGDANTDWQDEIFRGAFGTDHNVTLAGGLKNMPYRVSVGYTNQDGILSGSHFERTTASLTLNPSFFDDHLKFNINGKFMHSFNRYANEGAIGEAVRMDPTQPVYDYSSAFGNYRNFFAWTDSGSSLKDDYYPTTQNPNAAKNPVALLKEKDDYANSFDYMGNVEIDYQIHGFEDLRLHANLSGDWAYGKQNTSYANWGP